jgi:phosphoribosyl 1,2-cyclic phosphate phosphodiesterase
MKSYHLFMSQQRKLIVLGCGTSVGVPMLGCHCAVCDSDNPRNNRTRSSVLFQLPTGNLLVDTTPELRIQLLREKIDLIHSVLYTHYHVDHLFGLDDVRLFPTRLGGPLPLYCNEETEAVIRETFSYVFSVANKDVPPGFLPKLEFRRIDTQPFEVMGVEVTPIPLIHNRFHVLGFRVSDLAYCTDVNVIPESSFRLLEGLDTLIIDTLRPSRPHLSHFCLPEALEVIERIKPKRVYLTHMAHEMDYSDPPEMPDNVEMAYDGLRIPF